MSTIDHSPTSPDMPPPSDERRHAGRIAMGHRLVCYWNREFTGEIEDISATGLRMVTDGIPAPPVGTTIEIFMIGFGSELKLDGDVVRVTPTSASRHIVAVKFPKIDQQQAARLSHIVLATRQRYQI